MAQGDALVYGLSRSSLNVALHTFFPPQGGADGSSSPSPSLFGGSESMWQTVVTSPCVYNELAGNRRVFTLDLIVSTPALLLLSVFRAHLSAAAGCFKVCVCGVGGGGRGWYLCRSTCFFGPFCPRDLAEGKEIL